MNLWDHPPWMDVAWLILLFAASCIHCRLMHKPILFFDVPSALFITRFASGGINRFWGAQRCLIVALTDSNLTIRPWFPFNMFFFPYLFQLEHVIPYRDIISIAPHKSLLGESIDIRWKKSNTRCKSFFLRFADMDAFVGILDNKMKAEQGAAANP